MLRIIACLGENMPYNSLPSLTADELAILSSSHNRIINKNKGNAIALDPSNPQDKALILTTLKAAGQTPEKYPYLFQCIEKATGKNSETSHYLRMIDAGSDCNGNATATIWFANQKETFYSGSTLAVLDGEEDELLAFNHATDVQSGLVENYTNSHSAKKVRNAIRVLAVNHTIGPNGGAQFTALAHSSLIYNSLSKQDPLPVTAPVNIVTTYPNPIKIAVGRQNHASDCDYWYEENVNIVDRNPNLIVPFSGSYQLPYIINGSAGQPITGINTATEIYCNINNQTQIALLDPNFPKPVKPIPANYGILPATDDKGNLTVLNWNFPYGTGQEGRAETNSLVYGESPVTDAGTFNFYYQFTVPCSSAPGQVYTFSVASTNTPFPSTNCIKIPNLQYWWHCIASGTQVTMNDGNHLNIENINNSHRVMSGSHGHHLGVEATSLGFHEAKATQSGMHAVYRLKTEDGKVLVTTGIHPIMTPQGAVMTCYLKVGDKVLVTEGVSKIASCETIDYTGMFYDLKLGNEDDRAKYPQNSVCSYYANGILVGDHIALVTQANCQRYDLDYILPRIKEDYRTDYRSTVEDRNR